MSTIYIIPQLFLDNNGLGTRQGTDRTPSPVFVNQSSLDGACGHHSAFMTLLILGIVKSYNDVNPWKLKNMTPQGKKLWQKLKSKWHDGLTPKELVEIMEPLSSDIVIERRHGNNKRNVAEWTADRIVEGKPVMISYSWGNKKEASDGAHWVTCIGAE